MKCVRWYLKWRLYPMVRCLGQMYGPFHHNRHNFPCSLCLLCAQYDEVLEMPTSVSISYALVIVLGYLLFPLIMCCIGSVIRDPNLLWYKLKKKPLMLGPQKMMRRPPSLTMLYYCLGMLLSAYYITCLPGDCESSCPCLKAWGVIWGLGSASEICRMIHPRIDEN